MRHSLIIVAEITFKIKSNIIKLKTLEFYVCVPNVAYHDPLTEIGGSIFENSKILDKLITFSFLKKYIN